MTYDLKHKVGGAALLCLLLLGCAGDEDVRASQEDLLAAIAGGTAPAIVDVRTTAEYTKSHVPGAVHIPYHLIWSRHPEIGAAAHDPIVVYCAHGPRAGFAKFALWTLGYDNVSYLTGHMSAWKRNGLALEMTEKES